MAHFKKSKTIIIPDVVVVVRVVFDEDVASVTVGVVALGLVVDEVIVVRVFELPTVVEYE